MKMDTKRHKAIRYLDKILSSVLIAVVLFSPFDPLRYGAFALFVPYMCASTYVWWRQNVADDTGKTAKALVLISPIALILLFACYALFDPLQSGTNRSIVVLATIILLSTQDHFREKIEKPDRQKNEKAR